MVLVNGLRSFACWCLPQGTKNLVSLAAQKGVKKFVLVRRWLSTPYCCMRGKPCQPMPVSKDGTAPACLAVDSAADSGVGRLG